MKKIKYFVVLSLFLLISSAFFCLTASADGSEDIYVSVRREGIFNNPFVRKNKAEVWAEGEINGETKTYPGFHGFYSEEYDSNFLITIMNEGKGVQDFGVTVKVRYKGEIKEQNIDSLSGGPHYVEFFYDNVELSKRINLLDNFFEKIRLNSFNIFQRV